MVVMCKVCHKQFLNGSNLNKHLKNVHKQKIANEGSFKCVERDCNFFCQTNMLLISHLKDIHSKTFDIRELEFSTLTEFKVWKTSIEKKENCMYIGRAKTTNSDANTYYYYCNRSGKYIPNEERKRLLKSQGSCKLNLNCTSQIKVVEDKIELKCFVTWVKTHYRHGPDLQHIRISKEARNDIAAKLVTGASTKRILTSNNDKIEDELHRDNLLTSQDVRNVKRSFNIEFADGVRHKNYATSLGLLVKHGELRSECKKSDQNSCGEDSPAFLMKQTTNLVSVEDNDECLGSIAEASNSSESRREKMLLRLAQVNELINNFNFEGAEGIGEQINKNLKNIIRLAKLKRAIVENAPQAREPPNKKIVKQLNFKSTNNKRKEQQLLKKPSENPAQDISQMINGDVFATKNRDLDHNYC